MLQRAAQVRSARSAQRAERGAALAERIRSFLRSDAGAVGALDRQRLTGFGVFVVATRAGGKGRNPQTGEEITIKPSKQPRFRAGKQLKDSLN